MWKMIQTEWWKLRRCQILLVGIVALALCPVVQYGTQLIVNPEIRDPNFDFVHLFANVVWGNTQVFLPISLVMIGGWLIDRENTHDTMKNLLTVPVSYPKLLGGKLAATALLSLLFGLYSAAVTVLTGMLAGLPGLTPGVILQQGGQVVAAALTTFLVCMPMILIFGQMRGAYLGGSILAFFLGYCILFFKGGFLLSAYPFSAALVLAGFDMQAYNGATQAPSIPLALLGMASVIVLTAALLMLSRPGTPKGKSPAAADRQVGGRDERNLKEMDAAPDVHLFYALLLSACFRYVASLGGQDRYGSGRSCGGNRSGLRCFGRRGRHIPRHRGRRNRNVFSRSANPCYGASRDRPRGIVPILDRFSKYLDHMHIDSLGLQQRNICNQKGYPALFP